MHKVLVNRLGGLSLPRKSVVRLTDRPDMTLDVYRGRKTTIQYNTIPTSAKLSNRQINLLYSTCIICSCRKCVTGVLVGLIEWETAVHLVYRVLFFVIYTNL